MLPSFSDEDQKNRTIADTITLTEDDAIGVSISNESTAGSSTPINVKGPMLLESVKSGGRFIELWELIYDPYWSPIERNCCKIFAGFGISICIAGLIALTIGFVQVLNYVHDKRAMQSKGLFMIPNLSKSHGYLQYHINDTVESKRWQKVLSYVKEMDDFLEDPHEIHRLEVVDPSMLEVRDALDCNKHNNFGYNDKKPCFLIGIKNPGSWFPEIDETLTLERIRNSVGHTGGRSEVDTSHLPVVCHVESYFEELPSGDDEDLFSYYPTDGLPIVSFYFVNSEEWLKPEPCVVAMVLVKINNMERVVDKVISCSMYAENLDDFAGIKKIRFSPIDPDLMPYTD